MSILRNEDHNQTSEKDFAQVLEIIQRGKNLAVNAINVVLIDTYWQIGQYLSDKVKDSGWGKGIVKELSRWLARHALELKGFSAQNLWRMKQFYEIYHQNEKLSPAVRVLSPEAKGVFKDTYLLDFELAQLYDVKTKALKQAVKRNIRRFPSDFMFQLTKDKWMELATNCDHIPANIKYSSLLCH